MALINKKVIAKFKPCKSRFDNYLKYYGEKTFTIEEFMELENIDKFDKAWVACRLIPKKKLHFVALEVAELVLPIFEIAYPNDDRPRKALVAARKQNKKAAREATDDAFNAVDDPNGGALILDLSYDSALPSNAALSCAHAVCSIYSDDISDTVNSCIVDAYFSINIEKSEEQENLIKNIILKYWK